MPSRIFCGTSRYRKSLMRCRCSLGRPFFCVQHSGESGMHFVVAILTSNVLFNHRRDVSQAATSLAIGAKAKTILLRSLLAMMDNRELLPASRKAAIALVTALSVNEGAGESAASEGSAVGQLTVQSLGFFLLHHSSIFFACGRNRSARRRRCRVPPSARLVWGKEGPSKAQVRCLGPSTVLFVISFLLAVYP